MVKQSSKKKYTRKAIKAVTIGVCTNRRSYTNISIIDCAVYTCMMIPQYNTMKFLQQGSIEFTCMWIFFSFTVCQKRTQFHYSNIKFRCHFHQILPIKVSYFANIFKLIYFIFPLVRNVTFKKCQVYFEPLCTWQQMTVDVTAQLHKITDDVGYDVIVVFNLPCKSMQIRFRLQILKLTCKTSVK